jgi:hypothetical protein
VRVAAAVVVLLLAAAGTYCALIPPDRPLCADIYVDAEKLKCLAGLESDFPFELQREAGFITSPTVLDAALKSPEIARLEIAKRHPADPAGWLSRNIRVEFPAPKIVRIIFFGERTDEAARLVNAVAAAYVDEMEDETARLRGERIKLLERGQRDVSHRLAEKRDAIRRLEALLAACDSPGDDPGAAWTRELDVLRKAVEQGEEMEVRLAAELAQLKSNPHGIAVELLRPAAL